MFFMLCEIVLPDVLCFLYPTLCNEGMHVTSFIFIYCVYVLTEVCLLVLWVMVAHWFKFLSLLGKELYNNNQLSFALKH